MADEQPPDPPVEDVVAGDQEEEEEEPDYGAVADDPDAPYGRDENGVAYTKEEYDEWLLENPEYNEEVDPQDATDATNATAEDNAAGATGVASTSSVPPAVAADDDDVEQAPPTSSAGDEDVEPHPPPHPPARKKPPPPPMELKKDVPVEELNTLKYYLKQAVEAKNLAALTDLTAKGDQIGLPANEMAEAKALMAELSQSQMASDIETCQFYLKQALDLRKRPALQMSLSKAESINLSNARLHADFNKLVAQAREALTALDREEAETVKYYLNQGIQLRNRDVLKAAMEKADKLSSGLVDPGLVKEAAKTLERLDGEHLILFFIDSATKAKDIEALESALGKAFKLHMNHHEKVVAAADLLAHLKKKAKKKTKEATKTSLKQLFPWSKGSSNAPTVANANSKAQLLFGGRLEDAVKQSKLPIPQIVYDCVEFLRKNAQNHQGLFRVPGDSDSMLYLRRKYENSEEVKLNDINDSAGLLKKYIRTLAVPLIPFDHYKTFLELSKQHKATDPQLVVKFKAAIEKLPEPYRNTLSYLLRFLHELTEHSTENKMTSSNLAIVFAPNILRPEVETPQTMLTEMPQTIIILDVMIAHAKECLPAVPPMGDTS